MLEMLFATSLGAMGLGLAASSVYFKRREKRIREEVLRENKAASDAAHASETRWQLLFEQSPLSVQIFRPDGQTKRVNAAWRKLFHLTEEQGLAFNPLKDPDLIQTGAVNLIRIAFDEGKPVDVPPVPFPIKTDPPQTRWIGGVLYPVKDVEGRVLEVVTIHNDITEAKRAEEAMMSLNHTLEERVALRTAELEAARTELNDALLAERELGELKSRFVGMVSHEFRTPLGVTMSAVELIRHYDEQLSVEKRRELCEDIHSATRNMASLMEHVLLLGRVEAGKLGFKPISLNLVELIQKIVDEQELISESRCPIQIESKGEVESAVGDEALIRHILGNLISNAVKYSPAGEPVTVRVERYGGEAVCSIADLGIGIPEKDQEHLFQSFSRASNVGDIPGTGLGLVIVKRCVEFHGGSISVDSSPGQGTTFTVQLPVFQNCLSS